LLAVLVTACATLTLGGTASATPTGLNAANFRLQKGAYNATIGALDAALPKASLAQVVESADRSTKPCGVHAPATVASFCWQSTAGADDQNTTDWYPQGITTSADADALGTYQGKSVIATSWYWHAGGTNRGDRIAFVDYSDPAKPVYRFVLLVAPTMNSAGKPDFTQLSNGSGDSVHGGGIMWYGHYLYVVDTTLGLRVFDLDHIWQVDSGEDTVGLQANGEYTAFGYKYVLPQAFTYTSSTAGGYPAVRFSSTALDRTGTSATMLVSEYNTTSADTHRVIRYPMDETNFTLAQSASDGLVHGVEAFETGILRVQGTASVRGRYYASTSYSTSSVHYGSLYSYTRRQDVVAYGNVLQPYPEDLAYWPGRDELWSQSEDPGDRVVYAMRESLLAWPIVQNGNTGNDVKALQYLLNAYGAGLSVDGVFGPATLGAVKSFQSGHGLTADGIAGPRTWKAVTPALAQSAAGDAVRALQTELTAHGQPTPVTGTFDAATAAALRTFQTASGHRGDGVVDLDTWRDLIN
jgi:hypothetical protein